MDKKIDVLVSGCAGATRGRLFVHGENLTGSKNLFFSDKTGVYQNGRITRVFLNSQTTHDKATRAVLFLNGYSFEVKKGKVLLEATSGAACESYLLCIFDLTAGIEPIVREISYKGRGPSKYFAIREGALVNITAELQAAHQKEV